MKIGRSIGITVAVLVVIVIAAFVYTCQLHKLSARKRFRFIKSGIFWTKRRVA